MRGPLQPLLNHGKIKLSSEENITKNLCNKDRVPVAAANLCGVPAMSLALCLAEDLLHNLWSPTQSENTGPLFKKGLRMSRWPQPSTNASAGPSELRGLCRPPVRPAGATECMCINWLPSHNKYGFRFTDEQTEAQGSPEKAGMKVLKWCEWRKRGGRAESSPRTGEVAENTRGWWQAAPESCCER